MPAEVSLASKIADLHVALGGLQIPHAFGGALALAYYAEPRATHDIDVNVFVDPGTADQVSRAMERATGTAVTLDAKAVRRDGQARLWWGITPVDLFFAYDPIHDAMRRGARQVPFGEITIPILPPEPLVVCKAVFDRPQDWVDIGAMLEAKTTIRTSPTLTWLARIVGYEDPRYERLSGLLESTPDHG